MVRGWDKVGKAAPETFEDLVATEIRKGCPPDGRVAAQRVAQQYGFRACDNAMYKGESRLADRFQAIVKRIADEGTCSLEDATRTARLENPTLFKALQVL
jgi:hypothetical protein